MATQDDDATGCCCCATLAIVAVLGAVLAIVGFVQERPVLAVMVAVGGMVVIWLISRARSSRDEQSRAQGATLTETGSGAASITASAVTPTSDTGGETIKVLDPRDPAHKFIAHRLRRMEEEADRYSVTDTSFTPPSPVAPPPKAKELGMTEPSSSSTAAGTASNSSRPDHARPLEANHGARSASQLWTRNELQAIVEKSLRRDGWAVLRSGFDSKRGCLDVIAGRGHAKIAVQGHISDDGELLGDDSLRRLLAAPFHIHDIVEVIVVAPAGVLPRARAMLASNELSVHLVDGEALDAWRLWKLRLELQSGLVPLDS
ncbi:restriction endonuclease [Brachybacterium sp. GCM10030268]|uniref:restriction endonuclease n=1 Tax=Brachybacterium sp. GCM10030268 TaxID=3273382 RepID=UPI0036213F17